MLAHDFTLPDQDGKEHKLSDFRGKWIILYFYPKDDTSGCTKEACSFRDNLATLASKNVVVIGISADSPESHRKFIDKYKLNFLLLSDQAKEIIKQYNAWGKKIAYGKEVIGVQRKTYLINPDGEIMKYYEKVVPENNEHTNEILTELEIQQKTN
jgi:thioredoxin-dependent peroxiredoxin